MNRDTLTLALGAGALVLVSVLGAYAQVQNKEQQACINAVNKDAAAVAKAQGKAHVACVKAAGTGALTGTAQACLSADSKGTVAKATAKTTTDAAKSCGAPPSLGFTSAATANASSQQADLDLVADVYGANLDDAIIPCASSKAGCACQQKISKAIESIMAAKFSTFLKCKKAALAGGLTSAADLNGCVNGGSPFGGRSIATDATGAVRKKVDGLKAVIAKSCDGPNVTAGAFPRQCSGQSGDALGDCIDTHVECRVCTALNETDALFVNCDLFDDGLPNGSCLSGSLPTPTPTATSTPTPTATATCVPPAGPPTVLKGSLNATAGRFNYNLAIGLPAANSACNSHFAGTHACTYPELQSAATAGDLVCLHDINNNSVSAFWAIDNSAPPLQQCQDDTAGTGTLRNWEYPTAHTASRGEQVSLDTSTGALGPLQMSLQCNFSVAWVGCCQ